MRKLRPKKFVNYAEKLNYFGTKKLIDQQEPVGTKMHQPIQEQLGSSGSSEEKREEEQRSDVPK